jgi:hypothetical protein
MPYFLVGIRGDPARAAGLLAKAGIQNLVADEGVTARLVAENGENAVQRVRAALEGEPFEVEAAEQAPLNWPLCMESDMASIARYCARRCNCQGWGIGCQLGPAGMSSSLTTRPPGPLRA